MTDSPPAGRRWRLGDRNTWIGVLVGGAIAWALFLAEQQERRPVLVLGRRTTIVSEPASQPDVAFRIERLDGTEIKEPVRSVVLFFWNDGELAIRPEHVVVPIVVAIEGIEILSARVIRESRAEVSAIRANVRAPSEIEFGFRILDEGDGAAVQIIYIGTPTPHATLVSGAVEGVRSVELNPAIRGFAYWRELARSTATILMMIALMVFQNPLARGLSAIGSFIRSLPDRLLSGFPRLHRPAVALVKAFPMFLLYTFAVTLLVGVLAIFVYAAISGVPKKAAEQPELQVPGDLLP